MNDCIKLIGLELAIDETATNEVCPKCEGGRSKERTLSVTRIDSGLLFNCYRASCNHSGFVPSQPGLVAGRGRKKEKTKPLKYPTRLIKSREQEFFQKKFGLTEQETEGWKWCERNQRVLIPVRDPRGYIIALNGRGYTELGEYYGPKSVLYFDKYPQVIMDFSAPCTVTDTVCLVEDQVSSLKINRHMPAASLIGTDLSEDKVQYLINVGVKHVVLWLDSDAIDKAIKLERKHSLAFRSFDNIINPAGTPDPKDMTDKEIKECLNLSNVYRNSSKNGKQMQT